MTVWRLIGKEILHRKLNFGLGVLSVAIAIGSLVGSLSLLKAHDARTLQILAQKEQETKARMAGLGDDMRKAMLRLGFNIVILPKDQNLGDWYADDYASKYMPEDYATKLAQSKIITIQHLLPSLQQKVKWPEMKRTIILVGTRGEVQKLHADPMKPLVQPVLPGTIVLGCELHQSLGLKVGDKLQLLGRQFTVHACHAERGNKDDITAWISLPEAQELLGRKGQINAILAVECSCAWADAPKVRAEIAKILPDTQIIERASEALARAEARLKVDAESIAAVDRERESRARLRDERERLVSILVPVVLIASAAWIAFLAFINTRDRRSEIGILRALGLRGRKILFIFLGKAALMGIGGGMMGVLGGCLIGRQLGMNLDGMEAVTTPAAFDPRLLILGLALAPLLTMVASWLPALIASAQDPADALREE